MLGLHFSKNNRQHSPLYLNIDNQLFPEGQKRLMYLGDYVPANVKLFTLEGQ